MEQDELDHVLSRVEDIVPSSGFVAAVMDAVRGEAAAPPQIPFPWKRALAGLAACTLALVSFLIAALMQAGGQAASYPAPASSSVLVTAFESARAAGAGWIALALVLSLASVMLSMRLAGRRT
jgi:hypothetical protein